MASRHFECVVLPEPIQVEEEEKRDLWEGFETVQETVDPTTRANPKKAAAFLLDARGEPKVAKLKGPLADDIQEREHCRKEREDQLAALISVRSRDEVEDI